jgi:hypothetical protein
MKKLLLVVCCLALVSFVSCKDDDKKYKITVHLNKNGVDGRTAYAKIGADGASINASTAEYSGSAVFIGTQATLTIDDIEEGTYSAYIFIDADGDSSVTLLPDCDSDYATGESSTKIDDDREDTVLDGDWDGPNGPWCP